MAETWNFTSYQSLFFTQTEVMSNSWHNAQDKQLVHYSLKDWPHFSDVSKNNTHIPLKELLSHSKCSSCPNWPVRRSFLKLFQHQWWGTALHSVQDTLLSSAKNNTRLQQAALDKLSGYFFYILNFSTLPTLVVSLKEDDFCISLKVIQCT